MNKEPAELLQIVLFTIIASGQVFLVTRYYSRDDMIGMAIFLVIAVLSSIAAFGHFLAWRTVRENKAA